MAAIVQRYDAGVWIQRRGFDSRWPPILPTESSAKRSMRKRKIHPRRLLRNRPLCVLGIMSSLSLGEYGIVSGEPGLLTRNQREAIRKLLARRLKPVNGRYWVFINHFFSVTQKPKGARMGKGKGGFSTDKAPIRAGQVLCEFSGLEDKAARKLFASISKKLPVNTHFVYDSLAI